MNKKKEKNTKRERWTEEEEREQARSTAAHLEEIAEHVYACLSRVLGDPRQEIVTTILEEQPCIWVGRGVTSASSAVLSDDETHIECEWLPRVPRRTCERFKGLLVALGVREKFTYSDFVAALSRIGEANSNRPLNSQQLEDCSSLLESIVAMSAENSPAQLEDVLVPDSEGKLPIHAENI